MAYVALPMTDLMGQFNSLALYGFIWHYPDWQVVIMGLAGASYIISGINAIIFGALVEAGMSLGMVMLLFAGFCVVSSVLCFFLAPTPKEFYDASEKVLGFRMEGMNTPILDFVKRSLKIAWHNFRVSSWMILFSLTIYVLLTFWIAVMLPYNTLQIGSEGAVALSDNYAIVAAIVGGIGCIFMGTIFDIVKIKIVPFGSQLISELLF